MINLSITHDEAKFAHQEYYSGNFEVIQIKRSGWFDFPPFSFVYGISDLGGWDALLSSDGNKIVVTKAGYLDLKKVKETFILSKSDIKKSDIGIFKTTLILKNKVKGLTKGSALKALLYMPGCFLYLIPSVLAYFFMPSKIFQYRAKNEFKNLDKFNALLK